MLSNNAPSFQHFAIDQVPLFSSLDREIVSRVAHLQPFLTPIADAPNLAAQVLVKQASYTNRSTLLTILSKQYEGMTLPPQLAQNLEALKDEKTFCITTAHQPLLFGGKIYFLSKALSVIQMAQAASVALKDSKVVPVFVLGTEDHDLEEVRYTHIFGETLTWQTGMAGPVGRMPLGNIPELIQDMERILGGLPNGPWILELIRKSYLPQYTFGQATRMFLHQLLGEYGLIVIDLDIVEAKSIFSKIIKEEIQVEISNKLVNNTISKLEIAGIKTQAKPRSINLFYLDSGVRSRIERLPNGRFHAVQTDWEWSEDELTELIHTNPAAFSPNVILRPILQETILPNLVFIGGGGELAYWIELGDLFTHFGIPRPLLHRRHSTWLVDDANQHRLQRLSLAFEEIFQPVDDTIRKYVLAHSRQASDLNPEKEELLAVLGNVREKLALIDSTLVRSYESAEVHILKQLEALESKMVRGLKNKQEQEVQLIRNLYTKLLPEGQLQERYESFLPWLARYGKGLINILLDQYDPFKTELIVVKL
ncbi:MAG: bacillithiol biosynthesis cysteine-adding enzyme BshC [Saprospiraceae bacterium]|nr:bacillithiol biosynthesis cysteine-adding enzyme BshC [Saprospiraceae bacterium]